jgi:hypothetical protein
MIIVSQLQTSESGQLYLLQQGQAFSLWLCVHPHLSLPPKMTIFVGNIVVVHIWSYLGPSHSSCFKKDLLIHFPPSQGRRTYEGFLRTSLNFTERAKASSRVSSRVRVVFVRIIGDMKHPLIPSLSPSPLPAANFAFRYALLSLRARLASFQQHHAQVQDALSDPEVWR